MSTYIQPAIFKTNETIKELISRNELNKYLDIPYFRMYFCYNFWQGLIDAHIYENDYGGYLIELGINAFTVQNLIDTWQEIDENTEEQPEIDELIKAVQYCLDNQIEWLQFMII